MTMFTAEMLMIMEGILNPADPVDREDYDVLKYPQDPRSKVPDGSFTRWRLARELQVSQRMVVGLVERMSCLVKEEEQILGVGGKGKMENVYHVDREGIRCNPPCCATCIYQYRNYRPCVTARDGIRFDPPSVPEALVDAPEE